MLNKGEKKGLSLWERLEAKKEVLYKNKLYEVLDESDEDVLVFETHPFALRIWNEFYLSYEQDSIYETSYLLRMKKKYAHLETIIEDPPKRKPSDDDWNLINSQDQKKIEE